MYTYGNRKKWYVPSVNSFGDLVAFQGPPELAALGISSLHIPQHTLTNYQHDVLSQRRRSTQRSDDDTVEWGKTINNNNNTSEKKIYVIYVYKTLPPIKYSALDVGLLIIQYPQQSSFFNTFPIYK